MLHYLATLVAQHTGKPVATVNHTLHTATVAQACGLGVTAAALRHQVAGYAKPARVVHAQWGR